MSCTGERILLNYFPNIDGYCVSYILGILAEGEFDSPEDLFEAICDFLAEVCTSESTIQEACKALFTNNRQNGELPKVSSTGELKVLDTPMQMKNGSHVDEDETNVWLNKSISNLKVDQKKLEKTEAKLKEKQLKRQQASESVPKNVITDGPSASQQNNRKDSKMDASGINRSSDVRIENFDISFGERTLLSGADLIMARGRRYGLVGRNGIGKTTLLRLLASRQLTIPSHMTVLHVEQEVVGDDTPAIDSVLSCDTKRQNLINEEKKLSAAIQNNSAPSDASSRMARIYAELEQMEADKAPAKAAVIMSGLGFKPESQKKPTKEFSGGWRMRLALAQALFAKPDLLLLDEPTNMLDMKAVIWLEEYLQTWPSTILVVSHDREFLNAVSTDTLHLHSRRLDAYKGNFEDFEKVRKERLKNQQREYEAQMEYREHIQVFIDKFRYNANRASQVQSKIKILEKLPVLVPIEKETEVVLRFPEAEKLSSPVLVLDEVSFYYEKSKLILKNVNLAPNMDCRICIVGDNGAGKTTLLKILLGELTPTSGLRHAHRNLRIGYFNQHHIDQMDLNKCPIEVMADKFPGKNSEFYRNQLGCFGISGEVATRPVASLSGGQKSRVAFALISLTNPNFFILDEPTNHLDMETIEALIKALEKFQGGVLLVSHDERLIKSVCNEIWICGNQNVKSLEGGLEEYRKLVVNELNSS